MNHIHDDEEKDESCCIVVAIEHLFDEYKGDEHIVED